MTGSREEGKKVRTDLPGFLTRRRTSLVLLHLSTVD